MPAAMQIRFRVDLVLGDESIELRSDRFVGGQKLFDMPIFDYLQCFQAQGLLPLYTAPDLGVLFGYRASASQNWGFAGKAV